VAGINGDVATGAARLATGLPGSGFGRTGLARLYLCEAYGQAPAGRHPNFTESPHTPLPSVQALPGRFIPESRGAASRCWRSMARASEYGGRVSITKLPEDPHYSVTFPSLPRHFHRSPTGDTGRFAACSVWPYCRSNGPWLYARSTPPLIADSASSTTRSVVVRPIKRRCSARLCLVIRKAEPARLPGAPRRTNVGR
jgi:hypothetical protein